MRNRFIAILSSGLIASALGIGASAAMATTTATWTIKPGKAVTGIAGTITVTDTATGAQATCTSSSIMATFKSGTGQTNPIAKITAVAYNSCNAFGFGESITASAAKTKPWLLRGKTYRSGVTHGSIGNVRARFSINTPMQACTGIVAGTSATTPGQIRATYKNANGFLITSGGNLHAWNVAGVCGGHINSGDPITVVGTYVISPRQTITSP